MAETVTGVGAPAGAARGGVLDFWRGVKTEFGDKERRLAYYLVTPAVFIIVAIAVVPIFWAIWLSLNEISLAGAQPATFVGLANYVEMLTDDEFLSGIMNTTVFTVVSVALEATLGMAIALALNRVFMGRGVARATTLAPWALPPAVAAIMWRLMFQDQIGIMTFLAQRLNIYTDPILGDTAPLLVAAILVDAWKTTPFMALLLLAGLQVIPGDVYEAAKVDGATASQTFWRVTLPLVRPALLVALLFRTLDAWRVYDLFWVMGTRQLNSLSVYVYNQVKVSQLGFGLGNAAAVFVFVSSAVIAVLFFTVLGARPQQD